MLVSLQLHHSAPPLLWFWAWAWVWAAEAAGGSSIFIHVNNQHPAESEPPQVLLDLPAALVSISTTRF